MTEQEQQISISKACGWEWHHTQSGGCYVSPDKQDTVRRWQDLPDFLNDLNAMHSAVTTQPYRFKLAFNQELHATASTLGCLVCELKAADWAACFLTVERDRRKLNA